MIGRSFSCAYAALGDRIFLVSDRDDEKRKYHLYEIRGLVRATTEPSCGV